MKHFFALLLIFLLIVGGLVGCKGNPSQSPVGSDGITTTGGGNDTPGNTTAPITQLPSQTTDPSVTTDENAPNGTEDAKKEPILYKLNEDETAYIVVKLGEFSESELVIPSVYKDLPVEAIGSGAFADCSELVSVVVPESVKKIDSSAFYNCKNLTSVTLSTGVTKIGSYAFRGCESLTELTIPASVNFIGWGAIWNCTALTALHVENPEGWIVGGTYMILAEEMADPAKAVTLLRDTYGQLEFNQMNFSSNIS